MFKMDVIYIVPPSLGIRFIVDIYFFYRMWKQSSSLHLVSALEIERLLKISVMSMVFFFFWFITKDRLDYCWIVSTPMSHWGCLSCGCWAVTGLWWDVQSGCSSGVGLPPSLPLSPAPGPVGCQLLLAATLCSCIAEHKDSFREICSSPAEVHCLPAGNLPLFFLFFWCVFPCPVSQEQKYLLECTARVPKAVGSCTGTQKCTFGRNGLCHVWDFVMQRAVTKQSEFKLRARGIYLTWRAPKRGVFNKTFVNTNLPGLWIIGTCNYLLCCENPCISLLKWLTKKFQGCCNYPLSSTIL